MRTFILSMVVAISTSLSVGCGGGGASGGPGGPGTLTGSFEGLTIEGLAYETSTQSGMTNAAGQFSYLDGEDVAFSIGDVELGSVLGAATIRVPDLLPNLDLPTTNSAARDALVNSPDMAKLVNIAVLLALLDEDGALDNGVQIPPSAHSFIVGLDVVIAQPWEDFRESFAVRSTRKAGLDGGLWGGNGRPIPEAGPVLDALYGAIGINHTFYRVTTQDGLCDARRSPVQTFEYDADGRRVVARADEDRDGTFEHRVETTFNNLGQEVQSAVFQDNLLVRGTQYAYNANGDETFKGTDLDLDGTYDGTTSREFDAWSNLTRETADEDLDGNPEFFFDVIPGTNGLPESAHGAFDPESDGTANTIMRVFFDAFGQRTRIDFDDLPNSGGGDPVDRVIETQYNAQGQIVLSRTDDENDGVFDRVETNVYDPSGFVLLQTSIDLDGDGTADRVTDYAYTAGIVSSTQTDFDGDGVIDATVENEYNAQGQKTREYHNDGRGESTRWWTYDTDGSLLVVQSLIRCRSDPGAERDVVLRRLDAMASPHRV